MRRSERGFSLLEAIVAITITTAVLLAAATAVSKSLHASADSALRLALRDDALAVLADVRAATAYNGALLASMIDRTSTATITRPDGLRETMTVAVRSSPVNGYRVMATVTATHDATSVVEQQTLYDEAPSPGSTTAPGP